MAINYNDYRQRPYTTKDDLRSNEYFQSKFDCRIEDSKEYRQYVRQVPHYRDYYNTASYEVETQVVPMKAIHLSSESLEKLMAEQEQLQYLRKDAEEGKRLWREEIAERSIRAANPAVEKAWRNYQILLDLCR